MIFQSYIDHPIHKYSFMDFKQLDRIPFDDFAMLSKFKDRGALCRLYCLQHGYFHIYY